MEASTFRTFYGMRGDKPPRNRRARGHEVAIRDDEVG